MHFFFVGNNSGRSVKQCLHSLSDLESFQLFEPALYTDTYVFYPKEKNLHAQNKLRIANHRINQKDIDLKKIQSSIFKKHHKQFVGPRNNGIKSCIRPTESVNVEKSERDHEKS